VTDQPKMKQEDHPAHNMPPSYSSTLGTDPDTIFSVPDTKNPNENAGQGPTKDNEARYVGSKLDG